MTSYTGLDLDEKGKENMILLGDPNRNDNHVLENINNRPVVSWFE